MAQKAPWGARAVGGMSDAPGALGEEPSGID